MGGFQRALTDEQEDEILRRYIEPRMDPYYVGKPVTQAQLAKEYGVSQSLISDIIAKSSTIERMRKRTKASVLLAQAMAEHAAPQIMAETIKDALKPRSDKLRYLNQNAGRDVLDRAGVRAAKEDKQEVKVTFASGMNVRPKMPEREDETGE